MVDALFSDPRLAGLYDDLDGARDDLDHYARIVRELGAHQVLDVGCGTGSLACLLAQAGFDVVGVDPAQASLDVARGKPAAEHVQWIHGFATTLPPMQVDLTLMTGNVAQVFLTDEGPVRDAVRHPGRVATGWSPGLRVSATRVPGVGGMAARAG